MYLHMPYFINILYKITRAVKNLRKNQVDSIILIITSKN